MYFKLTDQNMRTCGGFQWKLGEWYSIDQALRNRDADLCTWHWFHCYNHPLLAVIFNPIHANIVAPRIFRCNVKGFRATDKGVKFGFTFMCLSEELELPIVNTVQMVAFGILAAKQVYKETKWTLWAESWLSGKDRTTNAAADAAANAAAYAAAYAATNAAAYAAAYAADAAANAAAYAADAADLDLISIAKQAMNVRASSSMKAR